MLLNEVRSRRLAIIIGIDKRYRDYTGGLDEWCSLHRVIARRTVFGRKSGRRIE
jgi:hypothetical protein